MAARMTEPATPPPEFCSSGTRVEQSSSKKANGFVSGEKPAAQNFNWLFYWIYQWLLFFKSFYHDERQYCIPCSEAQFVAGEYSVFAGGYNGKLVAAGATKIAILPIRFEVGDRILKVKVKVNKYGSTGYMYWDLHRWAGASSPGTVTDYTTQQHGTAAGVSTVEQSVSGTPVVADGDFWHIRLCNVAANDEWWSVTVTVDRP